MLAPELFRRFSDLAHTQAGIALKEGKETLVESRIAKRISALGLADAAAYADYLDSHPGDEVVQFLDVISTNFTSFFREPDHFQRLAEEAARWRAEGRERVRVWCAASSTGEEPYTLLMTLNEALGDSVDWKLLATDISTRVLDAARQGRFADDRLRGLDPALRQRYFTALPHGPGEAPEWQFRSPHRERASFGRLNLAKPPFPLNGPLDAIFCRNVMIYFDAETRQGVATEAERLLRPGGLLFIGHAETLNGLRTGLVLERPSVFRRR